MTYAFKYMWLRTFALPTGEDPDKISSAELDEKFRKEAELICESCGRKSPVQKKNGEAWPADQIVEYSRSRYGHALCPACMKEAEAQRNGA